MRWSNPFNSNQLGKAAEDKACRFLQQHGLTLVEKNYRCRLGEIDLIMQQGTEVIFVEVKFRSDNMHGRASEFVTPSKRKKLISAIQHYLHAKNINPSTLAHRLDLVAIQGSQVEWFKAI